MTSTSHLKICTLCSKRVNANSKTIHCTLCTRKTHLKCICKLSTCETNDREVLSINYLCIKCIENALPFMTLEENEYQTAIFEFQHSPSHFWNSEKT